jgi:hypothetical protein
MLNSWRLPWLKIVEMRRRLSGGTYIVWIIWIFMLIEITVYGR